MTTFPYTEHAILAEVDAFMAGIGLTITTAVVKNTQGYKQYIQNYYLHHPDPTLRYPEVRGPGIHVTNYTLGSPEPTEKWKHRQSNWFGILNEHLNMSPIHNHEYQLFDHIAHEIVKLGYPRDKAALTAYLCGSHVYACTKSLKVATSPASDLRAYAELATDPRLTDVNRHDIAHAGIDLAELQTYMNTGAPYSLYREMLIKPHLKYGRP